MKSLVLWVTLVALVLSVTAATAEIVFPGSTDRTKVTKPEEPEAPTVASAPVDKATLEGAVEFKTTIDSKYRVQDVVTVAVNNPFTQTLKGE